MRLIVATFALLTGMASGLAAAQGPTSPGVVQGYVTAQNGSIRLPGALLTVLDATQQQVTTGLSDSEGRFHIELPAGEYRVLAELQGFQPRNASVTVTVGAASELSIDLPLEGISQAVEVIGSSNVVSQNGTLAASDIVGSKELDQLVPGGGFRGALRVLASVIEVPGGVSIKGGRPNQASVQLGPSSLVDSATGLTQVSLPDDAIDSVSVLPNPYAVEYGRFSSGLVVIQTRRAGDAWKTRLNNVDPTFRIERGGSPFAIKGIAAFGPRIETGGPVIPNRLFLQQTAQYRYSAIDVASRPQNELRTTKWFSSFTRIDANLSSKHTLVASGGLFPSVSKFATLGTFTPFDATVDTRAQVNHGEVTERSVWNDRLFSESTVQIHEYETKVIPQGSAPMTLLPNTTLGNFFNRQYRNTTTSQLVETLSGTSDGPWGQHVFKAGIDVLHNRYDGSSSSNTVLIRRTDNTLARRLEFSGPTVQTVESTDVAIFAQDRLQPATRWYVEFGARIDRDGIIKQLNATPRIGSALVLNSTGTAVLHGGFGLFFERTPSTAGVFEQFEAATETRFGADGVTPLGPPIQFVHATSPNLRTSRSQTWDVAYDHHLTRMWSLHVGVVDRQGSNELIVNPLQREESGQLLLSSTGRSRYREADVSVHFAREPGVDVHVSYAHASARSDLNALTNYFNTVIWPVIGVNQFAPSSADVPDRLLARARVMPTPTWLMIGILDWRSGLPYSVVNDSLDFVGPRNEGHRFPAYMRLELGIEHRFKIFNLRPWIGVRVYNALNAFLPTDVQANLSSPQFGSFYNSEYRQFRLQLRFER